MSPLWGSRKQGHDDVVDGRSNHNGASPRTSADTEPDERTRLLQPRGQVYLSPEDPAVSPYNLWSVRLLRYASLFFLALTFIWWVLLLVSIFVSPPKMNSRGSGFSDFSFTTLTVANLLLALIFFAVPSKPMTIWSSLLSLFLAISLFIIIGVPNLRVEEGGVGIASVIWATVMALYVLAQTRSVAWGKREEEERLTGREETRRSLKEWIAILLQVVFTVITVIVSLLLMATLILRARDAKLPAPGQKYLVDNEKYRVHFSCVGSQSKDAHLSANRTTKPTILIEGGEYPVEDSFQPWVQEAYEHGTIERYCYWDRPGVAWSENAPSPHSAGMSADALSETLAIAGEEGPWVIVSAGTGGIYGRIFASRHLRDVQGIMLIDALHEDQLGELGNPKRGFLLWLRGIFSPLGLDRLAGAIFKRRTREDRVYGKRAYQGGKFIKAALQENLVADSMSKSEISSARNIQSPSTPLAVVSSGIEVGKSNDWSKKQEKLTGITNNLVTWKVVDDAPHEVWRTVKGRQELENALKELLKA